MTELVDRLDISRLNSDKITRTASGGVRIPSAFTRVGVLTYHNADGTTRRELRPPEEVFAADSLASLRDAPVVVGHPSMVDSQNWEKLSVGHVSGEPTPKGKLVTGSTVVQKADALAAIDKGELQEQSCGYKCRFDPTPGVWEGQAYDGIQRDIQYNHVGLGPKGWGRAGPEVALRLDGGSATFLSDASSEPEHEDSVMPDVVKIRLDGKEYVHGSSEHVAALEAKVETVRTDGAKALDTLQARFDAQATELEKAKADLAAALDPKRLDAAVDARVQLVVDAVKVLGSNVKLDGKTDREIMADVVKVTHPTIKLDGKSDEYVRALFDAGIASGKRADSILALPGVLNEVEGDQTPRADSDDEDEDEDDEEYEEKRQNRWKKPLAFSKESK